jgi:hypothetical protein
VKHGILSPSVVAEPISSELLGPEMTPRYPRKEREIENENEQSPLDVDTFLT